MSEITLNHELSLDTSQIKLFDAAGASLTSR